MTAVAVDEVKSAWQSLPRGQRATLASDAARGLRGRNRKDAAFMLWWAVRELSRGPRQGLAVAGAVVAAIVVAQIAGGAPPSEVLGSIGSSAIPIILLIPRATWVFRRPKLQRSIQLNAGMLSGKTLDAPPPAAEIDKILARAQRDGLLRPAAEATTD